MLWSWSLNQLNITPDFDGVEFYIWLSLLLDCKMSITLLSWWTGGQQTFGGNGCDCKLKAANRHFSHSHITCIVLLPGTSFVLHLLLMIWPRQCNLFLWWRCVANLDPLSSKIQMSVKLTHLWSTTVPVKFFRFAFFRLFHKINMNACEQGKVIKLWMLKHGVLSAARNYLIVATTMGKLTCNNQ